MTGSELPSGWSYLPLLDCGEWFGGGTPSKSKSEYWSNGTINWLSPKDMGELILTDTQDRVTVAAIANSATRLIEGPSVALVVRSGILERTLPVAVVPFSTTLNQDMRAVIVSGIASPKWIAYCLKAREREILARCRKAGTTVASIETPRLMQFEIPVAPIAEQERIVVELERRLSHVDQAILDLKAAAIKVKQLREAILWSAVFPSLGGVDVRGLPALLDGWEWTTLGAVAEVVGGVTKDAKRQSDPRFVEVPYLRVANVQLGFLKLDEVTTIRVHPDKVKALRLESGDILFNEGGDRDKLGRGRIWEGQVDDCIHQNHVFRARLKEPRLHPKFVSWVGNTFGRRWFEAAGKQTTNLASINKTVLESFPVPMPPPGAASKIVADVERRLSLVEAASGSISENLGKAASLRRSLFAAAFSGKLVPQDHSDEPADVLLARIREEHATADDAAKGKTAGRGAPRKKKEATA
jgi:type I restriction enzyme S subunit